MCSALRARARWRCALPSPETASWTWSMLLTHWNPLEKRQSDHCLEPERDYRQLWTSGPYVQAEGEEPGTKQLMHRTNPIWGCEWNLDSISWPPSQEWRMKSLPNRCVSFCWSSHWVLYTGSATACRDMYKCYSTPSHLKTINKVWEDQKQEKPSKK